MKSISQKFNNKTPVKWIGGFLFFFAFSLGFPWIAWSIGFIFDKQTVTATNSVVFATDLSLMIPVLILGGTLIWKRQPWGFVVSIMAMIKGVLYPMVLLIGGILAYKKTGVWDVFTPLYVFLWLVCIIFLGLLLGNMKPDDKG